MWPNGRDARDTRPGQPRCDRDLAQQHFGSLVVAELQDVLHDLLQRRRGRATASSSADLGLASGRTGPATLTPAVSSRLAEPSAADRGRVRAALREPRP